jgi:hypothetical protein
MPTDSVPVDGGGGGGGDVVVLETVTVTLADAVARVESAIVATSVWLPFPAVVVFHDTELDVELVASAVLPSSVRLEV